MIILNKYARDNLKEFLKERCKGFSDEWIEVTQVILDKLDECSGISQVVLTDKELEHLNDIIQREWEWYQEMMLYWLNFGKTQPVSGSFRKSLYKHMDDMSEFYSFAHKFNYDKSSIS